MSDPVSTRFPAPAGARKKPGRETAADMVRSLGVVLAGVLVVWYLAQPPSSDEQAIRVVDPSADVVQLQAAAPGVPVPRGLPSTWRATSSTLEGSALRIGWVTPIGEYAEYATADRPEFVADITGQGREVGSVEVGGVRWQQYADDADHTTLVRAVTGRSVAVGGLRETTTLDELRTLAAAVS